MQRVVVDSNIVVSSTISTTGKPAAIMNLCFSGNLQVYYTVDILDEYKRVLSYDKLKIDKETQEAIISAIKEVGTLIEPLTSTMYLPDESDRIFYDTAKASDAILITGNMKHYPTEPFIMTPADFLINLAK
jgi:putative PIN family toxin of toxin-antitoxin system